MAIAPAARRYGSSFALATAISFLTGLKIYHDDKTKKNRADPSNDSYEKDSEIFDKESLMEFI